MVLTELFYIYQTVLYILDILFGFPVINLPYLDEINLYNCSF